MTRDILLEKIKDPKFYLENFVKIKGKKPGLIPFVLNEAQKDLFNTLKTSSRVIICKARQIGFCLSEHTKILLSTLEWIEIKDIKIGDKIIAVDENVPGNRGQRKMRTAVVQNKFTFKESTIKIKLDNGSELVGTSEHKLLCKKWKSGTETSWKKIGDFKIGESIRYISNTWGSGDFEDGWFGGMIDGEGSLSKPVYKIVINKMNQLFEVLGKTRPSRILPREWWVGKALPNEGWANVISIEDGGTQNVVDLQTSEHTYIAEGFVSHNSTAVTGYFYHKTIMTPGTNTALIGYNSDLTSELLDKVKTFYASTPNELKPTIQYNSKYEISFPKINSKIIVLPSTENVGRGYTLHNALCTELSSWDKADEKMMALEASVPITGQIVVESTPKGQGNLYHKMWMSDNDYAKKEYGWWWMYTEEEIETIRRRMNDPMKFAQEYELTFLASGRMVFDAEVIDAMRDKQLFVGDKVIQDDGTEWIVSVESGLRIYKRPEQGKFYVIGVDVAEGQTGGDYSVATIWERTSGEEVAMFRGLMAPDKFAEKLDEWGRRYNNALMVVEINNHGLTTVTGLKQLMYPSMYFRPSKFEVMGSPYSEKLGWKTTKLTRPLLIDDLGQAMRDSDLVVHSKEILDEMTTFVYDSNNNMDAASGFHDDCIISMGIAYQGFKILYDKPLTQMRESASDHVNAGY